MKPDLRLIHHNFKALDSSWTKVTLADLILFVLLLLLSLPVHSLAWEGRCTGITDGDTIKVLHDEQEVKIRLASIDCPERGQPFSQRAKQFTSDLVFGKTIRVDPVTTDRYGRTVAWIFVDGVNVNHEIVKAGLGWWFRNCAPNDSLLEDLRKKRDKRKSVFGRTPILYRRGSGVRKRRGSSSSIVFPAGLKYVPGRG